MSILDYFKDKASAVTDGAGDMMTNGAKKMVSEAPSRIGGAISGAIGAIIPAALMTALVVWVPHIFKPLASGARGEEGEKQLIALASDPVQAALKVGGSVIAGSAVNGLLGGGVLGVGAGFATSLVTIGSLMKSNDVSTETASVSPPPVVKPDAQAQARA